MQTIGESSLRSYCPKTGNMASVKCTDLRNGDAIKVSDFLELARKVAELQYENREHVLMLRGQSDDYRNYQKNSTVKPSIFRGKERNPSSHELTTRFERLRRAESALVREYECDDLPRAKEIRRRQILRWAILQHYEVCDTPLLDVTHSLRVAASFASDHEGQDGYVMVLGVPNIAGAITTSIEAELQIVRLASVCPPQALRPHIQEGFLLGEYPDIAVYEQKQLYPEYEVDFGRRLIAKFSFKKSNFWSGGDFPQIPHDALYPDQDDDLKKTTDRVKCSLGGY